MIPFTFDAEANGWLSDPIETEYPVVIKIDLARIAPVVILKQEDDGGWANYGQSPKDACRYEMEIHPKEMMTIRLATPVEVLNCEII